MKASRVAAVGLVVAAALWIGSGYFLPQESNEGAAAAQNETAAERPFRVAVTDTQAIPHRRRLVLSGRTEADRKVNVMARTSGIVSEVHVRRGDRVEKGDVLAVLADEARDAQVAQARALLEQRRDERKAREQLVERGALPRLTLNDLITAERAAEAALASAEAERERGRVLAPWSGIVNSVNAEIGQGISSGPMGSANEIAQLLSLDPIIAVVEVAERNLSGLKVGGPAEIRLLTGDTVPGTVRYISRSASPATRTYRLDIEAANPDNRIPDGITAEVTVLLEPILATRVPRSALIFSSGGDLGVRVVRENNMIDFVPVNVVEDNHEFMWVTGIGNGARLVVRGQDFVREGQFVEAVPSPDVRAARQ